MYRKKIIYSQKGSMSIYAMATVLSILMILTGIFIVSSTLRKNQLRTTYKIKEIYAQDIQITEKEPVEPEEPEKTDFQSKYQQVEYIESTGTQYIDTGYIFNGVKCKIEVDFIVTKFTNGWTTISATQVNSSTRFGGIQFSESTNYCTAGNKAADSGIKVGTTIKDMRYQIIYDLDMTNNTLSVERSDNVKKNMTVGGYVNTNLNIYIFAKNNNSNATEKSNIRLYKYVIDVDGIKARNFIPCYSTTIVTDVNGKQCPAGTAGMYDTVEEKFYTNQGTGEFSKGADV